MKGTVRFLIKGDSEKKGQAKEILPITINHPIQIFQAVKSCRVGLGVLCLAQLGTCSLLNEYIGDIIYE